MESDRKHLIRPWLLGLLTALIILAVVWQVRESEHARRLQEARARVLQTAGLIRARLEGAINSQIHLVQGLVAHVAVNPDIGVEEFRRIAKELLKGHEAVRSVQLAKDSVITHIYPLGGNEKAQGLRLLEIPSQREAALRAIETGATVVAGPVNLVQGGVAFISRTPIYRQTEGTARGAYWGLASLLLDQEALFREAGFDALPPGLRVALRGADARGVEGPVFHGDPAVFAADPVLAEVVLPNGTWQLAAVPKRGWSSETLAADTLWIPGLLLAATGGWLIGLLAYRPQKILQVNRELEVARQSAERAARDRSRFLAAASHDVRQPLHALTIFISDLRERSQHLSDVRPLVEKIQYTAESLNDLFFSLMDISKLDAGVVEPEIKDFPVDKLLQRLVLENAPAALQKGLRLRLAHTRLVVRSDPLLLENLIRNLVVNAVKYTAAGGVLVGCRRRNGRVRIEVRDTGPGIPAGELDKIFEEFYQSGNPQRDRRKGLGLGLAIVRRLADLLGHHIEVHSTEGKGTVFSLEVERGATMIDRGTPKATLPATLSLRGLRVLVVDDEPLVIDAVRSLLENWNCQVTVAGCAAAAMGTLEDSELPHLILCDYQLARDEWGDQVVRELRRKAGSDIRAVLISGDTSERARRAAEAIGCKIWRKPVPAAKLRALLRSVAREVRTIPF